MRYQCLDRLTVEWIQVRKSIPFSNTEWILIIGTEHLSKIINNYTKYIIATVVTTYNIPSNVCNSKCT